MSGGVEALRHLELMALNTAQTASAARKVNECVALLAASLTAPPARTYAKGDKALQEACEAYVAAYDAGTGTIHVNKQIRAALATSRSQHEGASS